MTQLQTTQNEYDPIRCGEMFHKSGMFPDTKSAAQCATKLIVGQGMGLNAYDSMSGLNIIQGKVCLASNLMAAAIKRHPKYDYRSDCDNTRCKIIIYQVEDRPGHEGPMRILGTTVFTMEDAKRAGLSGMAWTKYPSAMLFARCISKAYREHCPDALGNAPVYVEAHGEFEIPKDPQPAAVLPSSQKPTPARETAAVKQVSKEEPMLEQFDEAEPVQAEETWRDHVETPQDEGSSLDQWLARDAYDPNTYVREVSERPLRTGTLYIVKIDQPIGDQNGPTGDRQINGWTTFDTNIGEAAKELQRKVASVGFSTNINGKYSNITGIEELAITEEVPPMSVAKTKTKTKTKTKPKSQTHVAVTDDDIPF